MMSMMSFMAFIFNKSDDFFLKKNTFVIFIDFFVLIICVWLGVTQNCSIFSRNLYYMQLSGKSQFYATIATYF